MKKSLLLLSFLAVGNASAYTIDFYNYTGYAMQAWIEYGGAGICSPDSKNLNPGNTKVSTGGCCPALVKVRRTDIPNQMWYHYYPSGTGYGISCRDNRVNIEANADGSLTLSR